MHCNIREEQPKVFKQTTLIYPVTLQELPNDRYPQGCIRADFPVEMLDSRRFKEAIISYGMNSPFVKQMLNPWSPCNRIIPQDWRDLVTAVLEPSLQLH